MNEWQGSAAGPVDARAEIADRVRQVTDALRAELHATENCWGTDEAGTAFAQSHAPRTRQLLGRLDAVPARLRGSAAGDERE